MLGRLSPSTLCSCSSRNLSAGKFDRAEEMEAVRIPQADMDQISTDTQEAALGTIDDVVAKI